MPDPETTASNSPAASKRNHALVMLWLIVWMASYIVADKAELRGWHDSDALSAMAIAIVSAIGIGVMFTYLRFLHELDELQRRIQLTALAFAMGIGLVGSVAYSLLITAGFVTDPEINVVIMLMGGAYVVALGYSQVRYR